MKKMVRIVSLAVCAVVILGGVAPLALAADTAKKAGVTPDEYVKRLLDEAKVREQERKRSAELFFTEGEKSYKARQFEKAEDALTTAVALDPNHARARKLLAAVQGVLNKGPAQKVMATERDMEVIQLGLQRARMVQATADARALLRQEDYDGAIAKLDDAGNIARVLNTRLDVSAESAEINSLTAKAKSAREAKQADKAKKTADAAKKFVEEAKRRVQDLQQQRITRLLEDAKNLYKDARYLDAARKCDEVLKLNPRNKEVIAFKDSCVEAQIAVDMKRYEKDKLSETASTWRRTRKEAIPYTDWKPLFPDDWEEKRLRVAGTQIEVETAENAPWKDALKQKLELPVSFDFIATPLDDVVAFLRSIHKVNIVVDKKEVGGDRDLTLQLEKVKFKDALEWALRLLDLKYTLENGAIFISSKQKIGESRTTVTRFYDVTDLTLEIRNFKPNIQAISNSDLDAENMDDIFSEDKDGGGVEDKGFTGDSLVEFIKSVIAPGSWVETDMADIDL